MSKTRPSYVPPKTLQQAKNDYKKNGPRISTQQSRQTARGVELYERAEKIKEAERRRKQNAVKKAAREERERDARRRMGIPSPRVASKVAASQKLLFGFVKVVGIKKERDQSREQERKQEPEPEAQGQKEAQENYKETGSEEEYLDDALDDTSLLEAIVEEEHPKCNADNDITNQPQSRLPAKRRRLQKTTRIQATTSFTSNDFVIAREITWTQDIEAAKSRSFNAETKETQTPVQDTTNDVVPTSDRIDVLWDDFLLSNTQLEREIAVTPPTIKADINVALPAVISPVSSDSFSTLPDSPVSNMTTSVCRANTADDTFLSLLSTQDLSFNISSPEMPRKACGTDEQVVPFVENTVFSPISAPRTEPQQRQNIMPPPTRPAVSAAPSPQATTLSACNMPPPPLPTRSHPTRPPPPAPTTTKQPSHPPISHPIPPQAAPQSTRTYQAQSKPATFLKPALPIVSRNRRNSCSAAAASGVMADWMPSDFELSTQDCREIGV